VNWLLRRIRRRPPEEPRTDEPEKELPSSVVRSSPGVAAIFAGLREDRSHTVLDLGTASEASLRLYGKFARWIRFVDLLPDPPHGDAWLEALERIPPVPDRPYDLVLMWNVMDHLRRDERPALIRRLAQLTAPGSRLYVLVDGSGARTTHPLRFDLEDVNRVRREVAGPLRPSQPQLLPAEVERLLAPFEVAHAFTLRQDWREYVAHRKGRDPRATTWWTR